MAESDTILQLGIEAAREGNREEARNLFGLLTRQEPNNAQAWLWLAGVAEGPEQRRAALERVLEIDPTNEMAAKGLQAMGVKPGVRAAPVTEVMPPVPEPEPEPAAVPPPLPPAPARELTDEERYAAELDSAFDDYDAVPRAETPRRDPEETAILDDLDDRPARATPRGSARERAAARRSSTPVRSDDDDDDLYGAPPPRRGMSGLGSILLALIVLALLGFLLYRFVLNRGGEQAALPTPAASAVAGTSGPASVGPTSPLPGAGGVAGTGGLSGTGAVTSTGPLSGTGELSGTPPLTSTTAPVPTVEQVQPQQPQATAAPPAAGGGGSAVPAPAANPNLQPVAIGAQLQANGWTYSYPSANYVVVLGKQSGNATAQGTYVHVLVWVANNTGTDQPLPANFFALKDANNTVYTAAPQVSSALVQRGINADKGMEDPIPANGVPTSVYLVFDVPPGAQGLTLFASGNNGQGWPLNIVP